MFNRHKKRVKSVNLTDFYSEELKNNAEKVLKQRISSLKAESGKENSSELSEAEIMKALECCPKNDISCEYCKVCPYLAAGSLCMDHLIRDALDLINRKNAEIEALQAENKDIVIIRGEGGKIVEKGHIVYLTVEQIEQRARAEAIKEVLEKVETVMFYDETEYVNVLCLKRLAAEMGVSL